MSSLGLIQRASRRAFTPSSASALISGNFPTLSSSSISLNRVSSLSCRNHISPLHTFANACRPSPFAVPLPKNHQFKVRSFSSTGSSPNPEKKKGIFSFLPEEPLITYVKKGVLTVYRDPSIIPRKSKALWEMIKHEAQLFWIGCKTLAADVRIASKLLGQVQNGRTLNRSERRLLVRVGGDILRLVPFSLFVIIPFAELTLPFFLKMFPNMLPSPFIDPKKKEDANKKQLQARLEMAKFLQEVVEEKAEALKQSGDHQHKAEAEGMTEFLRKIQSGQTGLVSNDDLFRYSKFFRDDFTLEHMSREHLELMCKFIGIRPFRNESLMRIQLRLKLKQLKKDDQEIHWEGIDTLTDAEVIEACRARGMKCMDVPLGTLRNQLAQWLRLSMNRNVPSSLLILSRAFTYTDFEPPSESSLKQTIATLDLTDASLKRESVTVVGKSEVEIAKANLEALKQEEAELKESAQVASASAASSPASSSAPAAPAAASSSPSSWTEQRKKLLSELDKLQAMSQTGEKSQQKISDLISRLNEMLDSKNLTSVRAELEELKQERSLVLEETQSGLRLMTEDELKQLEEQEAYLRKLNARVDRMLDSIEKETIKVIGDAAQPPEIKINQKEIEQAMQLVNDGVVPSAEELQSVISELDKDGDGLVSQADVERVVKNWGKRHRRQ